ncbi:ImmA/IrrE family metallo-endopeptidase [Roseateles sp.]|jgi:Zn-dependent peptidase ImmA (M78 family)|uniref:ImmA/IrrE family metallo-endopeptidase n=1 Tax=Roseateles sp. TaxID=1971397 RepID=UPI0031DA425A
MSAVPAVPSVPAAAESLPPSREPAPLTAPAALPISRYREIDAVADELRREHGDPDHLPVSVRDLAEGAGIEVRARGGPQEPTYPYRGRLLYLDDRPVIELNIGEEPRRRRIVLAHAMGHHVLGHGPVPPETRPHLSTQCPRRIEQEAHHFALELLMPDVAIYRLMNQGMVSARRLAERFHVPEDVLHERLQTLDRKCGYL